MSKKLKLPLLFILAFLFLAFRPSPVSADIFWSTPEQINTSGNYAVLPATMTGPNGYFHTVWTELDPLNPKTGVLNPGVFYSYWNGDAWSEPVRVSQNTDGFAGWPAIAVTADNTAHVIWEDDSTNPVNSYGRILYSSSTDYGNSWSAPVSVAESLDVIDGSWSWWSHLTADSANNLHVTFIYWNDYEWTPAYYTKCAGSCNVATNWDTPERLTVNPGYDEINNASLAVDSNNHPHVVLEQDDPGSDGTGIGIYHTYFNGTSWEPPEKISPEVSSIFPKIIIDGADNVHVTWARSWHDGSSWKNLVEYIKKVGSSWTSPYQVTEQADFSWLTPTVGLTFDSDNNIYVGWGERIGWPTNPKKGVQVNYKKWSSPSGPWSDPIFMRYVYDLSTPFLYKDKWDNQHFAWVEQDENTDKWSLWYSTIPVNVKDYNPAAAFNLYLNITNDLLSIPPNALTDPTLISAQIGPLPASYNPDYTTLPRSYTYRPHGTTFFPGKEAEAKINYTDEEVIGSDEANLKVYIWDSSQNAWSTSFTTSVQTIKNQITVDLPHFSLFGIAAPKVKVGWLPPISKAEPYELKEGSTLPVKFTLSHFDETPLNPPELPEDVVVRVKDGDKQIIEYSHGTDRDSVRYDPSTKQYIVNVHTKELELEKGIYTVEVLIFGQTEATEATRTQFEILEKGKVRGTTTE